jgi:hypothetical protein
MAWIHLPNIEQVKHNPRDHVIERSDTGTHASKWKTNGCKTDTKTEMRLSKRASTGKPKRVFLEFGVQGKTIFYVKDTTKLCWELLLYKTQNETASVIDSSSIQHRCVHSAQSNIAVYIRCVHSIMSGLM